MKKLLFILSLCFCFVIANSQVVINRTTGTNTVNDPRQIHSKNLVIPRYLDTTAANVDKGIDSSGAIIYTYTGKTLWLRQNSPKKWTSIAANISTFNFITDSSIVICFGSGDVCDTINIGGDISNFLSIQNIYNNSVVGFTLINGDSCVSINLGNGNSIDTVCANFVISNYHLLNDSTIIVCDSLDVNGVEICDTLHFTPHPLLITQNWIRMPTPGIWEFGTDNPELNPGYFLDHNTYTNTGYHVMTWDSRTVYDYGHQFKKSRNFGFPNGTGVVSFLHPDGLYDHQNDVRVGINYTADTVVRSGFVQGYFGTGIGYSIGTNWQGHGSFGIYLDNNNSKTTGIFLHTFDSTTTDGVTIYAAPDLGGSPPVGNFELKNYKVMGFTTDKYSKAYGRFQLDTALATAANNFTLTNGNVFTVSGSTQINAITTTGWQAGSTVILIFSGSPTVKHNTAGGAGTAPIILAGATDFAASANDVLTLSYNGTNWYETTRKLAAFAPSIRFGVAGEDETATQPRTFNTGTNTFQIRTNNGDQNARFYLSGSSAGTSIIRIGDAQDTNVGTDGVGTTRLQIEHTSTAAGGPNGYFNFKLRNTDSMVLFNGVSNTFRVGLQNVLWDNITNATASNVLYYNSSTKAMTYGALTSAYPTLQQVFNTEVGGSVLTKIDSIQAGAFAIRMYGTIAGGTFQVYNTSNNAISGFFSSTGSGATAVYGSSTSSGTGVYGSSVDGNGGNFQSTNNIGLSATSQSTAAANFTSLLSSTNSVATNLLLYRSSTGTAADGIGMAIDFRSQTTNGGVWQSNQIQSLWSTANHATRTSKFIITGTNSGTGIDQLTLFGTGQLRLNQYPGSFTGTSVGGLGVESDGDVIVTNTGLTGTYEPTSYNVTNVSASTPNAFVKYYRVGDMVTVYGSMDVDPTAAGATEVDFDLPFASNMTRADDCVGVASSTNISGEVLTITGDTTNDRVQVRWVTVDISNRTIYFHFSYQVK